MKWARPAPDLRSWSSGRGAEVRREGGYDVHVCKCRVGQNRICAPYMTVYLVIPLPKITYIHHLHMVLANPMYVCMCVRVCVWVCVGVCVCADCVCVCVCVCARTHVFVYSRFQASGTQRESNLSFWAMCVCVCACVCVCVHAYWVELHLL